MTGWRFAQRPRRRPEVIAKGKNLKVIGRAGIGVDNINIDAATAAGIVVMNTPFGNAITTAEHAIAMMFALARKIPQANQSTHDGKWEKSKFMGAELFGKTLGVIGCGNIGSIVADRAIGVKMRVSAYDPFLTDQRAVEIGVKKVELDELLAKADVISLHTPLTDQTRNILSRENLAKTKKGVLIVNCARGGLVDEAALKEALDSGHVGAAALDVFETEPATENPLFGHERVVATPHLGASTQEAQEECSDTGRRTDGGLPDQGRCHQCVEHAVDYRGRSAAPETIYITGGASRRLCRPINRDQRQSD